MAAVTKGTVACAGRAPNLGGRAIYPLGAGGRAASTALCHGAGPAFPPQEAKRLADKLESHHTPKHGSWLNIAEIELSVLSRQCLDRRVPDVATLQAEVHAWQEHRNRTATAIDRRFTTEDARIKLKRLYPSFQE
jgi:hypothetical protein